MCSARSPAPLRPSPAISAMAFVPPPPHPREAERLAELAALRVLDSAPEPSFTRIVTLAKRITGYRIALVSLVDTNRQWFKACAGPLEACETGRDVSFCGHAILGTDPFIVEDSSKDPRFASNPLVTGEPFVRAYCGIPLVVGSGLPVGTLCLLHDSPRRPTPEQLESMEDLAAVTAEALRNRARAETVSVMSHEVRSPLSGIVGLAWLLQESLKEAPGAPPDALAHAKLLGSSADHLLRVVNDVLEFSRLDAGKLPLEDLPYDVRAEAATVLGLLAAQASKSGTDLSLDVADGVPQRVRGDAGRLRQVLLNLLGNAVKFSPGRPVSLSITPDGPDRLHFSVRDGGIGMPPEAVSRLFEAFGQADASTARMYGGSGLGLVICRRLVGLMGGGTISVESEQGRGSVFSFSIAAEGCPPEPEAPKANGHAADAGKRRVLVADDNPTNRLVAEHMLRRLGHTVSSACDGLQAVELASSTAFDLVLLDLQMPSMGGREAAREIRKLPGGAGARIWALTGEDPAEVREGCEEAGMDGVLGKPVSAGALQRAVAGAG
ncbi:sensor histidine kinase and response regulator of a two component complex [Hyaloraphidium curvatum]|nr:sensor histidine kinase and response regulator of a two component complex [Hyaloraphidium curvatum]